MKYLIVALVFQLGTELLGQSPIEFEDVVAVEDVSAEELYKRAEYWAVKVYNNPDRVMQIEDPENGHITVTGGFHYNQTKKIWGAWESTAGPIRYTMDIYVRDGRYKYRITQFSHHGSMNFGLITDADEFEGKMPLTTKGFRKKIWDDIKMQSKEKADELFESLQKTMTTPLDSEDDNW